MSKHFIEKPKKPACFQIQNILFVAVATVVMLFFEPIFIMIFATAMTVFFIYDYIQFKHMPEAILYAKDGKLFYFNKILNEIKLTDIIECKVSRDKKANKYIDIDYHYDELKKRILIKEEKSEEIVDAINKMVTKAKNKQLKEENKTN